MTTKHFCAAIAAVLTTIALPSQSPVTRVLPQNTTSGYDTSYLSLFNYPSTRLQMVIGSNHLAGLTGASLQAITLRCLKAQGMPVEEGTTRILIKLSHTNRTPGTAATQFSQNHGTGILTLFDGIINLKNMPSYTGPGATPWNDPRNVAITFTTRFPYLGGNVCLEIESKAVAGKSLPVWHCDGAVPAGLPTTDKRFGNATTGTHASFEPMLFGIPAIGENLRFSLSGVMPNAPALFILGFNKNSFGPLPLPFPILGSGNGIAWLNVSPDVPMLQISQPCPPVEDLNGNPLPNQPADWHKRGELRTALSIPWNPALSGSTLYTQWFASAEIKTGSNTTTPGLASTQGMEINLASPPNMFELTCLYATSNSVNSQPLKDDHPAFNFTPVFRLAGSK